MTKVKICGNTSLEDAKLAAELGADYLGFIFAEGKRKIDLNQAKKIRDAMPDFENFVAVFFNQSKEEVQSVASALRIRTLQFHGDETALYCQSFTSQGYNVIKTFRIKDAMSLKRLDEYDVEAFLFDAFSKEEKGGTGKTFDWNLIVNKPFVHEKLFLAGGLNVENVAEAIQKVCPFAVDVASGVEKTPGKKDPEFLKKFISIVKEGKGQHVRKNFLRS